MEYSVKSGSADKQRVSCVVVGVFKRRSPSEAATSLDAAGDALISSVMRRGDMDGELGSTLMLHRPAGLFCDRILLVGCGKERDFDEAAFRRVHRVAAKTLNRSGAIDVANYLSELRVKGRDCAWQIKNAVLATEEALYRFDACRGSDYKAPRRKLDRMSLAVTSRADLPAGEAALAEAQAMTAGVSLARDLGNLPGNICTPSYLADQARTLSKEHSRIKTRVLEEEDMQKLGMGALLAVSSGSRQPAKLIVMEFMNGSKGDKPVVLVGKGLTFDAGGISIKPSAAMDEMKYDMCGGASVFGAMKAAALQDLKINLVGVVPSSENLPDGQAVKPGDIVTSMSGITIEILNTDAEGRLILCDALTYVEKNYDPEIVVDMATLTGACVVALGAHASGLFTDKDPLARKLINAGESVGDRAWRLPLWSDYQSQLKSPFADVANVGGRDAGAITAACFLHRFTKKLYWAHLDIAGSAWTTGSNKSATGRPVPLLFQFLLNQAASGDAN